jgi:uncharacterized protein (TIGR02246 family)
MTDASRTPGSGTAGPGVTAGNEAAAVRRQLEQIYDRIADAMKRGDAAVIGEAFAPDAAMLMLDTADPPVRGREAIVALFKQFMGLGRFTEAAFITDEVLVDGDTAYEPGSNRFTIEGQTRLVFRGRYVTIWRRQSDGAWQIIRDIGTTPKPLG